MTGVPNGGLAEAKVIDPAGACRNVMEGQRIILLLRLMAAPEP